MLSCCLFSKAGERLTGGRDPSAKNVEFCRRKFPGAAGRTAFVSLCFLGASALRAASPAPLSSDVELRRRLVGTWELESPDPPFPFTKAFSTYRAEGVFSGKVVAKIASSQVTLEVTGEWRLENGTLIERITKAPNTTLVGQESRSKIISLDQKTFVTRSDSGIQHMRRSSLPAKLPPPYSSASAILWSQTLLKAAMVETPQPDYPYEARRLRIGGRGLFHLSINREGMVESVQIVQSTGNALLDKSVLETLKRWRIKPGAMKELIVPVVFRMNE